MRSEIQEASEGEMNCIVGEDQDKKKFLALVLEPGNIHRLQTGLPIRVSVEGMFPDGIPKRLDLMIAYSATPVADARSLTDMAEVTLDERTPIAKDKRPHCPECRSTVEQVGVLKGDPISMLFCPSCGCTLGLTTKGQL